jgi:hypothetical protein
MLSKKDFRFRRKEKHSENRPAARILIQVSAISDSIIAHFGKSTAYSRTFTTASVNSVVSGALGGCRPFPQTATALARRLNGRDVPTNNISRAEHPGYSAQHDNRSANFDVKSPA